MNKWWKNWWLFVVSIALILSTALFTLISGKFYFIANINIYLVLVFIGTLGFVYWLGKKEVFG